jgi:two-component system cell cycle sensor histidine kinase/response regulator CckA
VARRSRGQIDPTGDDVESRDRRFQALVRNAADFVSEVDAQGHIYYASPNHDDLLGTPLECFAEGFGSLVELVAEEDRERIVREFTPVFREGATARTTFRVLTEGAPRWFEITASPFEAEDGSIRAILVSRDVSAAKLTEEHLRTSRERFRQISENAYDMIAEYSAEDGRLLYTNPRTMEVLGYGPEAESVDLVSLLHPEDRSRVIRGFMELRTGATDQTSLTYRAARADGSWCWIDANLRSVRRAGERHLIVIARDVTARVEAEGQLRESEARYRELIEGAPVGILVLRDGAIVFGNRAAAQICGAESPEQLEGREMIDLVFPEEAVAAVRRMADARKGSFARSSTEIRFRGLDGRVRKVAGTGSEILWRGSPAYQAVIQDVTEWRRIEEERQLLELQLQEARKLESLGSLAGGIAHDFNNLLAVILANLTFARRELREAGEVGEALGDAVEAAKSAARLTSQLLAYAGRRSPDVREVDLSLLVEETSALLGTAVSGRVQLELDLARDLAPVRADSVQLEQVLMNLVINASEAIGDRPGTIRVTTYHSQRSAEELRSCTGGEDLPTGLYVTLEVRDTGSGMEEAVRRRIFDPFFTTRSEGHGLGLSAVLGLVIGHRGAIDVETAPGRGTSVAVHLPAACAAEPEKPEEHE